MVMSGASPERASDAAASPATVPTFSTGVLSDSPSLIPRSSRLVVSASGALSPPAGAPLTPVPVASAAGACAGAATPGAAVTNIEAMLDDISSICDVQGTVTSVVDGAFPSPQ